MADDRNWDRELAKIDKLIGKLPEHTDEVPAARSAPQAPARPVTEPVGRPGPDLGAPTSGSTPAPAAGAGPVAPSRWARAGVWLLASVGVAASAALPFWPFGSRCGAELLVYLAAVAGTGILGLWTSIRSWKVSSPRAHVVGLLVLLWAISLAAWQVMPRVGVALPTADRPAVWGCGGG
jgi:hypothetical protein